MNCPRCQTENTDSARFCSNCAAPISTPNDPEYPFTETLEAPTEGLAAGTTFASRYEVIGELGIGGMGRVYKARDTEINEEVAIKLLKPEIVSDETTVERFRNELILSRKIAHKNICKMYHMATEGLTPYITMEYVQGEDLKSYIKRHGKLSHDEALTIATQVCEGLVEAHELGIVHRDLKPQNIMIDEQGRAKIMDFGIARSVEAPGVTQTGIMIGTPAYISPEQAEGIEADQRADIYALGVVLFEMVTGSVPFKGDTALSVALKHKAVQPAEPKELNPEVSAELNSLIMICMEKDRERRYQTTKDLLSDLQNIEAGLPLGERKLPPKKKHPRKKHPVNWRRVFLYGAVPALLLSIITGAVYLYMNRAATIHSIAVLPFENLTGDAEQEYFVDGIADELIGKLGRIKSFQRVISFWTASQYKEAKRPLREIAEELDVEAVVTGSVQKSGGSVSLRVRLMQVLPEEQNLWEETYDRPLTDVLVMSGEIAQSVAREIRIRLTEEEETRLASARQVNPETYQAYLKGMSLIDAAELGPNVVNQAITFFNEAIEKDPTDPMAYAGLALGYSTIGHSYDPTPDAWPRARAAADRALRLDPELAEGYAALADVKFYYEWDWEGAERAFLKANELNPNLAMNHYHYSWFLAEMGRRDEAIKEHKRAQELDPLTLLHTAWLGGLYTLYGEYALAKEELQKVFAVDPDNMLATWITSQVLEGEGKYDEAVAWHEKIPGLWWSRARLYAKVGRVEEAREIMAKLEEKPDPLRAWGLAACYATLGENDKALEWLNYKPHHAWMPGFRIFPWFNSLHDDPRFHELLQTMNMPPIQ
jgi:serine/threonine protein kinase/tetratricopeptide (TPR) repeat protein